MLGLHFNIELVQKQFSVGEKCNQEIRDIFTWIPSDAAQAFNTSGSTATMATRDELKLSPAYKLTALGMHDDSIDGFSSYGIMNITIYEALSNELALGVDILDLLWSYVLSLC